ncbi:polyribonucleotide nucleotidyltransferase 1, mitochondrial isoform X1 [Procambarus clarkii]|uniref:polyribonucleotide nucleotidyltransferase 1, mitochondrial isoform X1 n=1 Tax=Procambarus clarkii TaxID=6728 RepID=UPI001E677E05|nr:polyribonucleotide nucleotidyltransferase 1, mitochondrial-like isoform X1 [Procambarus clarkii]
MYKVYRHCGKSGQLSRYILQSRYVSTTTQLRDKVETRAVLSNGRTLHIETGGYARLADGAAVATLGDTSVLITAVSKPRSGPSPGFMPLTVDYRQKYAAAGRIPSNYFRRELAPTDKEILTSRIIDRSVRPLFPVGYCGDTQLSCQLLAVDGLYDPDVVSINAASAALAVSDIPWMGPVGSVRMGLVDGEVIIQPTRRELSKSSLNLVVSGAENKLIVMLEGGGSNVLQQDLMKAIKMGVKECQLVIKAIQELAKTAGKTKRSFTNSLHVPEEMLQAARTLSEMRLRSIFTDFSHDKFSRDNAVNVLKSDVMQKLIEGFPDVDSQLAHLAFSQITKTVFRNLILDDNIRCDGRGLLDLRPISCGVDLYRPLHGSSLFQRGQTQVQCTVAFDAHENIPKLDPLLEATGGHRDRNFILHYTFPSFATNEVARSGPISRREVGHGALAEKALRPLLPSYFPFAILLTSTVLESNGSSSMATVCGGSLALMDAGVNISAPAAGIAIGLVTRYDDSNKLQDYKILTDILGIEDYMGDMDFKLAGTSKGITALQADVKVPGIPLKVVMEAIQQATDGKGNVLTIMGDTIAHPRENKKETMPVLEKIAVPAHKRSKVMGPGGMHIRRVQSETGVQLTWQEDGILSVFAPNLSAMEEAKEALTELLSDREPTLEFGGIYTSTVVELRPQGVMVTLYDDMPPVLLHNSQLDTRKVHHPSALGIEVGQQLKVKYFGRDPASGQMRLSRRALQASAAAVKNLHKAEPV